MSGTLSDVNTTLSYLIDTDTSLAADTITIQATDGRGGSDTATIAVGVNAPPAISAPSSALVQESQATAIAGVSIADTDAPPVSETITATLGDASGDLSASNAGGATVTGAGSGRVQHRRADDHLGLLRQPGQPAIASGI